MSYNQMITALMILSALFVTWMIWSTSTQEHQVYLDEKRLQYRCSNKVTGARAYCWDELDWKAYCKNTGVCVTQQ